MARIDAAFVPGQAAAVRAAAAIYAEARSSVDVRLWRAALGAGATARGDGGGPAGALGFDAMLAVLRTAAPVVAAQVPVQAPVPKPVMAGLAVLAPGLGANGGYAATIEGAAQRTGVPAAALAAIIGAEAGRDRRGAWVTNSRNSRSSAAGLGQFLSGTWASEAQRAGTWLNRAAQARGWLAPDGAILPQARAELLALRDDAEASIEATADYARASLDTLVKAGVAIGGSVEKIAEAAYIGHNLGAGDAIRFLGRGLDDGRARRLLDAQIGPAKAQQQIAATGSAAAAHRGWLKNFIGRHLDLGRFGG
jgi:hypothetical protein